jgi:hypothetical protein
LALPRLRRKPFASGFGDHTRRFGDLFLNIASRVSERNENLVKRGTENC